MLADRQTNTQTDTTENNTTLATRVITTVKQSVANFKLHVYGHTVSSELARDCRAVEDATNIQFVRLWPDYCEWLGKFCPHI